MNDQVENDWPFESRGTAIVRSRLPEDEAPHVLCPEVDLLSPDDASEKLQVDASL